MNIEQKPANRSGSWHDYTKDLTAYTYWSPDEGLVDIMNFSTSLANQGGEYQVRVRLTLSEVASLINTIATDGIRENSSQIGNALAQSKDDLLRLLACAAGMSPQVPPALIAIEEVD